MQMYGKGFKKLFENSIFTENLSLKKTIQKEVEKLTRITEYL